MEETALMNIKEDIFNMAKQENLLSDKTHIFVKTGVENAVDADGKKIINYNVDFTYEVEEEFSARDDFKPGRYHVEESNAAMIMLQIMTKAFEQDFAKYMVEGKQVKIKVKGSADASPINRALAYDGSYGEFDSEPVYLNNELSNVSLSKKEGIATNEQLAFARALGVQQYIEKEISAFGSMKRDYEYHIEVSKEAGSQFRRISVQYTFINAF
jgi:cell division protein YceG involved in septum cleavage